MFFVFKQWKGSSSLYTAKNHQPVAMLLRTGLNNLVLPTLFEVVNNGEHAIQPQRYCSMLLTVGSTTLFNPVELQLIIFCRVKMKIDPLRRCGAFLLQLGGGGRVHTPQ